jgi:hypothetical protein
MYSASQIAAVLNKSKRGVLLALASTSPSGRAVVSGNPAWTWKFDDLPGRFKEELAQQAKQRGYAGPEALLSNPPPVWSAPLPLKNIAPHHLERATKLQSALKPFLEQTEHSHLSRAELEAKGVEEYQRVFGHSITTRHWRRLMKRTRQRDGGAKNWARLEIYLDENPARKPVIKSSSSDFRELENVIAAFKNPLAPTATGKQFLWVLAFEYFETQLALGQKRNRAKHSLLRFLTQQAPLLARTTDALRRDFNRKYRQWVVGGRHPSGIADRRNENSGNHRAPTLEEGDELKLVAKAVEYGGRESQAWRELVAKHELSPQVTGYYLHNPANKSYVPRRIREAVRSKVEMLKDLHHGPRQAKLNGAYIERDPTAFAAGDWFQADDCTLPNYYYEEAENGFEIVLISARNYNARHIRNLITIVADDYGLPQQGFYFENGTWRARLIVGRSAEVDWLETELGLRELGLRFCHATLPRGKVIERVFGIYQNYLEAEPGYAGRDERNDRYERVQKQLALIRQGKAHPSEFLLSKLQWIERLTGYCEKYNHEPQNGKYLPGLSPKEGFEKFFQAPLVKLPDSCRYLLASHKMRVRVGRNGISFQFGKERFTYKNEQTGRLLGQQVLAWFNPENPDLLAVTDLGGKNPFVVERAILVPGMDAPPEILEQALEQNARHEAYRKALYRTVQSHFSASFRNQMFRPCYAHHEAVELGQTMCEQRKAIETERNQKLKRFKKAQRLSKQLNIPVTPASLQNEETMRGLEKLNQLLSDNGPISHE